MLNSKTFCGKRVITKSQIQYMRKKILSSDEKDDIDRLKITHKLLE